MAKLIYTTAVAAFFLLFAFSHALISDTANEKLPSIEGVEVKESVNELRLPSERSGSESEPEFQIGSFELKDENKPDGSTTTTDSVPLTFVNFRPAGRPFPLGHRRGCRHARRNGSWGPRRTVSYGNDMVTSSKSEEMKLDRHFRGGERQIPAGFRHGGPGFEHKHHDDDESHEMERVRPHRHHRRHHHHDHDEEEEVHEHGRRHHHGGHGLFGSIRKFLNGF